MNKSVFFKTEEQVIFKDRQAAGKLLAKRLEGFINKSQTIILGIPRGGVVVAAEIASQLHLPLDIVITRKIGDPFQPELALGAIDPNGQLVWDEDLLEKLDLKKEDLKEIIEREKTEIKRREKLYRGERPALDIKDQNVILVDDGIATGATVLAALRYLRSLRAGKIILAVPVVLSRVDRKIEGEADELVILYQAQNHLPVGGYYQNFQPVSDQEVEDLIEKNSRKW